MEKLSKYKVFLEIDVRAKNNTDASLVARELIKHSGCVNKVIELPKESRTVN